MANKLLIRKIYDVTKETYAWQAYSEGADREYYFAGNDEYAQYANVEQFADYMSLGQDTVLIVGSDCFAENLQGAEIQNMMLEINQQLSYGESQEKEATIFTVSDVETETLWTELAKAGQKLVDDVFMVAI